MSRRWFGFPDWRAWRRVFSVGQCIAVYVAAFALRRGVSREQVSDAMTRAYPRRDATDIKVMLSAAESLNRTYA